ncbi:MAG: Wzt carbohydrate-binding domain-containing protein, partial [Anaerolineae bacterium]
ILVSHNLDMVRKLCTRLVWMEKGKIRGIGEPETIIQQYLVAMQSRLRKANSLTPKGTERLGTGDVEITAVRFIDKIHQESNTFVTGDPLTIEINYCAHQPVKQPEFGLAIYRDDGIQINGPNSQFAGLFIDEISGRGVVRYQIPELPLLPARYVVTAAVHDSRYPITYDHHEKAYEFQVVAGSSREIFGLFFIPATWSWSSAADALPEQLSS